MHPHAAVLYERGTARDPENIYVYAGQAAGEWETAVHRPVRARDTKKFIRVTRKIYKRDLTGRKMWSGKIQFV